MARLLRSTGAMTDMPAPTSAPGPDAPAFALKDLLMGGRTMVTLRLPYGAPLHIASNIPLMALLAWGFFAWLGAPLSGAVFVCALILSILLHEVGHAFGAWLIGHRVEEMRLNALSGSCRCTPIAHKGRAVVFYAMGPVVNLVIFLGAVLALMLIAGPMIPGKPPYYPGREMLGEALELIALLNGLLLLYNLIPVLPHDGGHILRLTLSALMREPVALRLCGALGLLFAVTGPVVAVLIWQRYDIILPLLFPVAASWHIARHGTLDPVPDPPETTPRQSQTP